MRISKWVMIGIIVTALVLPVSMSSFAQETTGLSSEQIALIDRAVAARNALDDFTSYVETAQGQSHYEVSVQEQAASASVLGTNIAVWSREVTVVRDQGAEYIQAKIASAIQRSTPDEEAAYSVDAEARVVDDVLYVNAAYSGSESDILPDPLPEDWQIVEDVNSHPVYADLKLDELIDAPMLFDAPDVLVAAASDVTLASQTSDDGVVTHTIRITIDAVGMATVLRDYQANNSTTTDEASATLLLAMAEQLDDSSRLEIVVVLDDEDRPLVLRTTNLVRAFSVPGDALGVSDAAARINIISDNEREQTYSRFDDAGLSPVPRPSIQ